MIEFVQAYGGFAALAFIIIRVFFMLRNKDIELIEKNLRAKWQAEFFDRNHADYIELRDKYDALKDDYYKIRLVVARLQDKIK